MVANASQFIAMTCAAPPTTAGAPCPIASVSGSGSADGTFHAAPLGHKCSDEGTGSVATVTITVVQRISSGIDNDATSTMAQQVMCTCGLRIRKRFKPIHTTPPKSKERSADSARIASIISSLLSLWICRRPSLWPSPLHWQPDRPVNATDADQAFGY